MIGIEFLVSLFVTAIVVFFIRYKMNQKKKANETTVLRQKDIKRKRKEERKKQKN